MKGRCPELHTYGMKHSGIRLAMEGLHLVAEAYMPRLAGIFILHQNKHFSIQGELSCQL
jgi:hypothetical protein